jgi:tetratricopeptide (TPR) repeat protein
LHPCLNNYFWKAAILLSSQKLHEAASTYLTLAALKDTDNETKALAYNNAGYTLYLNHNYEGAMEAIEKGLGLMQDKSNLYKNKGLILEAQGNYDGAMDNYNRALEIDPDNPLAITARGNLSAKLKGKPMDPTQYLEWEEIKLYVPSDKVWTIAFNRPVDLESAKEYIHIEDEDKNQLSLKIEAGNSANEVKVSLSNGQGYAPSVRYTLFVPSDVQTTGGVKMISGVKMDFISK